MKNSLFISKIIYDPTLLFGTQLQFEYVDTLLENLQDIYLIAKEKNQKQITIACEYGLNKVEEKLIQAGFSKSLISLELNLESYNAKEVIFKNEMLCKQTGVSFLKLKPLLIQQAKYHSKNYPSYYKTIAAMDFDHYQKVSTQDLNNSSAHNLFLLKDGKLFGLILGEIKNSVVHIYEFVIDEELRGKGIGTQLLEQYLFMSKKAGAKNVVLETWWNQPVKRIYEKFGFVTTKQEYFKNL